VSAVTIDAAELETLRIDAAVGAFALLFAEERRAGVERRAVERGTPERRLNLEDARELWDRR
jgi:hypothetical protein